MKHNLLQELHQVLTDERQAFLSGGMDAAVSLQSQKENLMQRLEDTASTPMDLAMIAEQVQRNQHIIRAVIRGLDETGMSRKVEKNSYVYTKNGQLKAV